MTVGTFRSFLIAVLLAVIIVPAAISLLTDVDTSGWDATLVTIWNFLPLIVGIVVLVGFLGFIGRRTGAFVFAPLPVFTNEVAIVVMSALLVAYMIGRNVYGMKHRKIPRA